MDLYKKVAQMGLTTLIIPEEYGGGGMNQLTCAIAMVMEMQVLRSLLEQTV